MKKILFLTLFTLLLFSYQGVSQPAVFVALHASDSNGIIDCQQIDTNLYFTILSHSGIVDAVNNGLFLMDYNTSTFALPGWYSDNGISYYFWSGSGWNPCVEYCGLPPITISGDSVVYAYSTTNYSVIDTVGSSYNWVIINGNVVSGQGTGNIQIQWGGQGNGLITLIETSLNVCIDTLMLPVTILGNTSVINNSKENIIAYPNPSNDKITIMIEGYNGPLKIAIYDFYGRLIKTSSDKTIDLNYLAAGGYLIKVSYAEKTKEIQIFKE